MVCAAMQTGPLYRWLGSNPGGLLAARSGNLSFFVLPDFAETGVEKFNPLSRTGNSGSATGSVV